MMFRNILASTILFSVLALVGCGDLKALPKCDDSKVKAKVIQLVRKSERGRALDVVFRQVQQHLYALNTIDNMDSYIQKTGRYYDIMDQVLAQIGSLRLNVNVDAFLLSRNTFAARRILQDELDRLKSWQNSIADGHLRVQAIRAYGGSKGRSCRAQLRFVPHQSYDPKVTAINYSVERTTDGEIYVEINGLYDIYGVR